VGTFAVGDVVLVPFPYADFSKFKKRPALVVGKAELNNLILCQITSKAATSRRAIPLYDADFAKGTLNLDSYIRFDKLFTAERSILESVAVGSLKSHKIKFVQSRIREIFSDKPSPTRSSSSI
jgi:mRNA interferase MazF